MVEVPQDISVPERYIPYAWYIQKAVEEYISPMTSSVDLSPRFPRLNEDDTQAFNSSPDWKSRVFLNAFIISTADIFRAIKQIPVGEEILENIRPQSVLDRMACMKKSI